jgi:hypothetical protein
MTVPRRDNQDGERSNKGAGAPSAAPDEGTPSDLLPGSGRVAKARATYESVYLVKVPQKDHLQRLDSQVDLTEPLRLYERPAEGVIVTTEQEWVPVGVGLGRLLHSVALAPGESTRIAVVDWSRQVTGRTAQTTTQTEEVTEEAARHRGVTEISRAVARELQQGSSVATSDTTSTSAATSGGFSGLSWGFGGSASTSASRGVATNVSRSSGYRGLSTNSSQQIAERAAQLATSSRDLRATVVMETSEAEASTASTRVVTNYNHMHALTVQYWEVIQEYELRTRTKRCERCVFVPMKVLVFNEAVFRQYKRILVAAAPESWQAVLEAVDPFESSVYRTRSSNGASDEWNRSGPQPTSEPMGPNPPRLLHFGGTKEIQVIEPDPKVPIDPKRRFLYHGLTDEPQAPGAVGWDDQAGEWVRLGFCKMRGGHGGGWWKAEQVSVASLGRSATNPWSQFGGFGWLMGLAGGSRVRIVTHDKPYQDMGLSTSTVHRVEAKGLTYRVVDGRPVMSRELHWSASAETPPASGAERLTVWWDGEGVRGVKLWMRGDDADAVIGDVDTQSDAISSGEVSFEVDERVTEVVLTRQVTPRGRVLRRITIMTDRRASLTLGPELAAEAESRTTHERLEVRGGVLCGLFGSFDPIWKHVVSLGFQVRGPHLRRDIFDHLNDNALHYSQAIWANADELALTRILANYEYDDGTDTGKTVPLGDRLDPAPVAMTGNYLGFRWHFRSDEERKTWMDTNDLVEADEHVEVEPDPGRRGDDAWQRSTVSLATDGVFAEAVLGRSNGAEKLDITRFWDWQTSPIPILPSEIAPVETGTRARDIDLQPARLEQPTAVTRPLPNLPDPAGTASILQALAAGNLFRDMSGLEATSALLQKGIEVAAQSEGRSAEQATQAMQQANEHMEKMSRIAVDAAKEVAPLVLGPAGALGNSSKLGALLNYAARDATAAAEAKDTEAPES